jgi:hypothetical protein
VTRELHGPARGNCCPWCYTKQRANAVFRCKVKAQMKKDVRQMLEEFSDYEFDEINYDPDADAYYEQ